MGAEAVTTPSFLSSSATQFSTPPFERSKHVEPNTPSSIVRSFNISFGPTHNSSSAATNVAVIKYKDRCFSIPSICAGPVGEQIVRGALQVDSSAVVDRRALVKQLSLNAKRGRLYAYWTALLELEACGGNFDLATWRDDLPDNNITFVYNMLYLTAGVLRAGLDQYARYMGRFEVNVIDRTAAEFAKDESKVDSVIQKIYKYLDEDAGRRVGRQQFSSFVGDVETEHSKQVLAVLLMNKLAAMVGLTFTPSKLVMCNPEQVRYAQDKLGSGELHGYYAQVGGVVSDLTGEKSIMAETQVLKARIEELERERKRDDDNSIIGRMEQEKTELAALQEKSTQEQEQKSNMAQQIEELKKRLDEARRLDGEMKSAEDSQAVDKRLNEEKKKLLEEIESLKSLHETQVKQWKERQEISAEFINDLKQQLEQAKKLNSDFIPNPPTTGKKRGRKSKAELAEIAAKQAATAASSGATPTKTTAEKRRTSSRTSSEASAGNTLKTPTKRSHKSSEDDEEIGNDDGSSYGSADDEEQKQPKKKVAVRV